MVQNLYRASRTQKLRHFNLRISTMRYATNIFNRDYVTQQKDQKDDESNSFKDLNLQVTRDLQKLNPIEIKAQIAGAVIGLDPSFKVTYLRGEINAHSAFEKLGLKLIKFGPKEGLALINGVSFSTALQGSIQPFDPFVHKHKPHKGQYGHSLGLIVKHIDTQIALLVSPEFNNNLPPSLLGNPKTNIQIGLKGLQICANSIMPILLHQGNHISHLYPTHAEQYNQNINSQSFASANLTWNSIDIMKHYLAISLIFAVQSIELRTFADFQNYNVKAYLSPKLIPLYKTIYEILGCEMSGKKPLTRNGYEQPLDSYVQKIVNDLNDPDGSILNLMV
ncbi:L-Aspartase-like protein [Gigaspora rosea]|uniref:L-Aspartase-like protein n=1 Tax=Gigaspora rosea TaxID=44941 RepID=A0A397UNG8_9GLOM|nr:L-Aspartase-like protein [Gigaspora rosea]